MIEFTQANIVEFMWCPHYPEVKGIGLEGEIDWDEVAKVLTDDEKATWPDTNRLIVAQMLLAYRALFRVCCGNWLPAINVTTILKDMEHLLYSFVTKKKSIRAP